MKANHRLGERIERRDGDPRSRGRLARSPAALERTQREIAELKARLRAMEQELLRVEERERMRLSIDLHDGLSQTIALVKMKLGALRRVENPVLRNSVLEIEQLISQANHSARSITFELSPRVLEHQNLEESLRELALSIGSRYGVRVVLEDDGRPAHTDANTRVILFRSVRELLINAAKHARSNRICVRVEHDARTLRTIVEDDGVGMSQGGKGTLSAGLFGIRERLGHLGGSMSIESNPGRGTRVCLSTPLAQPSATRTKASA